MNLLNLKQPRFSNGNITPTAEFLDTLSQPQLAKIDAVTKAIRENRRIADRESDIWRAGIMVVEKACGSGGVGSILPRRDAIYIQIGYGHGRYNYAKVAVIN